MTAPAWRMGKLYAYHNAPPGPRRFDMGLDFEPWELTEIPPPRLNEDFGAWALRLTAAGWIIDWDTP